MPNTIFGEAADAMEELSKPRWIPVTERLPEEYEEVLIYGKHGVMVDNYVGNGEFARINGATHWMPLLKPPKEKT